MKKNELLKDKWLITIDLDGTTLGERDSRGDYNVPEINKLAIDKLKKLGHHVAIVTGRPWRLTKHIYEHLGIDTIVVNHNGAYIHRPNDPGFRRIKTAMNRQLIEEILAVKELRECATNLFIDFGTHSFVLDKSDKSFLEQAYILDRTKDQDIIEFKLDSDKLEKDPFTISIRIDTRKTDMEKLIVGLRRKYRNGFAFRYWDSHEENYVFLEINALGASKGTALKIITSYYNLPLSNTIAFGDGLNDIQMIELAEVGVAMKNGNRVLRELASDVTDYTNAEGGVGRYLNKFFDLGLKD